MFSCALILLVVLGYPALHAYALFKLRETLRLLRGSFLFLPFRFVCCVLVPSCWTRKWVECRVRESFSRSWLSSPAHLRT